ncbi:NYN domain limkain-b1-type [Arabidopsis thaliana x Arabidopsis arenosa]|uniref:NYN domain limkain-b1-type n=1 Tax=Arabidopsis thaliana x Arabidopsis arenosa TaxID=1240361 RepID=A0A8T1ZQD7_9BRAS|nr:NYN domain limkain-b1-type [Arabidopsis thaliana x Arabidopsis arenosa]
MNSDGVDFTVAKTAVFWDIEDCPVPDGLNAVDATNNIKNALKNAGFNGEVSIFAFGGTKKYIVGLNSNNETEFHHFPQGDVNARRAATSGEIFNWLMDNNRQRTNLMMIIGDTTDNIGLMIFLHDLVGAGYNLLTSQPPSYRSVPLHHSVSTEWLWPDLGLGKDPVFKRGDPVLGKWEYFNGPAVNPKDHVDTDPEDDDPDLGTDLSLLFQ